eukprot:3022036-Pyramimonas_sp.AAC.1
MARNDSVPSVEWEGELEEDVSFLRAASQCSEVNEVYFTKKRGGHEVHERRIPAEEWPMWRRSDASDWKGVLSTGCVIVLSLEEGTRARASLQ